MMQSQIALFRKYGPMPGIAFVFLAASATLAAEATQVKPTHGAQALEIMARANYQGGLVVHLGCGDGQLTAALHRADGSCRTVVSNRPGPCMEVFSSRMALPTSPRAGRRIWTAEFGLYVAVDTSKAGQILVFDDKTTYGLHTFNTKFGRSPYFAPGAGGHELFADDNTNEPVLSSEAAKRERGTMSRSGPPKWSVTIPVRARAMVLAGETLFLAGPPDVIDPDDPYGAFEGRKGGRLWAVSTAD